MPPRDDSSRDADRDRFILAQLRQIETILRDLENRIAALESP